MSVRRFMTSMGLVFLAAACAEGPSAPTVAERTPNFLRWGAQPGPQFVFEGAAASGTRLQLSGDGPTVGLTEYQAQFWAVRGQARTLQINYSGDGGTSPFLRFTATDPVFVPGLGALALGDSVLITATVNPTVLGVKFQPEGLSFGTPAQLVFWYGGAGGDLNGDGVVDEEDAYVEAQLLGMWYQATPLSPWTQMQATKSLADKSLTTELQHFSGYSVAW